MVDKFDMMQLLDDIVVNDLSIDGIDYSLLSSLLKNFDFVRFWEVDEDDLLRFDLEFQDYSSLKKLKKDIVEFIEQLGSLVEIVSYQFESIDTGELVDEFVDDAVSLLELIKDKNYLPSFSIKTRVV